MERILRTTADGSHTIAIPSMQVTYHSTHGAIQESKHVFIESGLDIIATKQDKINILEMGFGTGLNALLTMAEAGDRSIRYETVEAYPLDMETISRINYCTLLKRHDLSQLFLEMHTAEWNKQITINENFQIIKHRLPLSELQTETRFHLVYFDAFDPKVQPELWTVDIFRMIFEKMENNGILVTYSSKGSVRRAMKSVGFTVEKIPGPPGKWEMVRAHKTT